MITTPTIALIIPIMNEYTNLEKIILYLPLLNFDEVVIVDGGSTDGTGALLEASSITYLLSQTGRAKQMNIGVGSVTSDILLFLHADTQLPADGVAVIRHVMHDTNIVGGRFDVSLSGSRFALRVIAWFINMRSRLSGISTGDQCQFVRRDVFETMGGFADIALLEDVEFSKRLKREGKIACLPEQVVTSSRRWEKHGILRTIWLMWKIRLLYWLGVAPEKLARMYRDAR